VQIARVYEQPMNVRVREERRTGTSSCDFRSGKVILQQEIEREQMRKLLTEGRTDILRGVRLQQARAASSPPSSSKKPDGGDGLRVRTAGRQERGQRQTGRKWGGRERHRGRQAGQTPESAGQGGAHGKILAANQDSEYTADRGKGGKGRQGRAAGAQGRQDARTQDGTLMRA
jgi:hypothetical protein